MKVVRETIVAGKTILRALRVSTRLETKENGRSKKTMPTPEAVWKVNCRNAVRDLTAKLNHNFTTGDWHVVLTYANEPTKEQAKKDKEKFLRKLRERMFLNGTALKRVDVTEYLHKRIHHHIVCSYVDIDTIEKFWPHGYVKAVRLDSTGNYKRLAEYLIKETSKTYRQEDSVNKRRYNCSRSIVTPEIKREIVTDRELKKDPEALKGYYIDQDSVRKYEHAITRVDCVEYIMVSLQPEPRLKRWSKGKAVKRKEHWKAEHEDQQNIFAGNFELL